MTNNVYHICLFAVVDFMDRESIHPYVPPFICLIDLVLVLCHIITLQIDHILIYLQCHIHKQVIDEIGTFSITISVGRLMGCNAFTLTFPLNPLHESMNLSIILSTTSGSFTFLLYLWFFNNPCISSSKSLLAFPSPLPVRSNIPQANPLASPIHQGPL